MNKNLFVVGIGASAGGLNALEDLFSHLPTDSGAAYVVIQHLSPNFKSLMKELLQRHTTMDIYRVKEGMELKPNSVFLIPPGKNLVLEGNILRLEERVKVDREINFPIDLFFTSLAKNYQDKAIAVILSGSGSDGTHGMKAVNEAGGVALVQKPDTAEFDGMPNSAIATGIVNRVLPPSELATLINQCIVSPLNSSEESHTADALLSYSNLKKIAAILLDSEKIDFSAYKSSTISRRIHRRRLINNTEEIGSYIKLLHKSKEERKTLCSDLLINVTHFFRDKPVWKILENEILSDIVANAKPGEELRFWIAGCSTGQEAYSVAILLHEAIDNSDKQLRIKIFATDIDLDALRVASAGIYPQFITKDISRDRLQKYFVPNDGCYQITRKIREMIIFSAHNLTKDAVFTRLHFASCRNVLIYMKLNLQQQIFCKFHFALRPQGILLLGEAESVGQFDSEFNTLHKKWKIYQKKQNTKLLISNPNISKPTVKSLVQSHNLPVNVSAKSVSELSLKRLLHTSDSIVLIVDRHNRLLHVYGDTSKVLQPHQGRVVNDVTRMVIETFQLPLNTALHRAKKEQKVIDYRGIKFKNSVENYQASLRVIPPDSNRDDEDFYLVKIEIKLVSPSSDHSQDRFEANDEAKRHIFALEHELQYTRENLQTLVEELETINEEQQASNEELTASNEELQSTNEELHSVNEELHTVNIEYQSKIGELTELNNDIDNLLKSTDIGVVFLDAEFKIRKFTPAVRSAIALRPADLERPLEELNWKFDCPNLFDLLREVLELKESKKLEVKLKESNSYLLMQIHLYQNEDGDGEGLVISFVKIDEIKQAQNKLEAEIVARQNYEEKLKINQAKLLSTQERVENIFSSLEDAVWSFDLPQMTLGYLNTSFEKIYGRTKAEFLANSNLWFEVIHPEDKGMVKEAHRPIRQQGKIDLEYRIIHPDNSIRWVRDRTKVIYNDDSVAIRQDFVISDITVQTEIQQTLNKREQSFHAIFNSMFQFIGVLDPEGIVLEVNQTALAFGGLNAEDVLERPFWQAKWWTISEFAQEQLKKAIALAAEGEFVRYEVDVLGEECELVTIDFSLKPVMNQNGVVVRLIYEGREISELKQAREELKRSNLDLEQRVIKRTESLAKFSDRLQQLHRLAVTYHHSINDCFDDYLRAGCQMLNLSTGIVSKINDCIYEIIAVKSPLDFEVGYKTPCVETYCAEVVETQATVAFSEVGQIESMQSHPVYLNLKLESFIGTPIFVNGNLYGTLNFSDTVCKDAEFSQEEIKIVELMAKDIGNSIASVRAEAALKESELRFRNTFEQAAVGVAHLSTEGSFIKVNQRFCDILDYDCRGLLNTKFQDITYDEDLHDDLQYFKQMLSGKISNYSKEKRYIKSDNSLVWVNLTVSSVKDSAGQVNYLISVVEDISDRKKAEIDLKQSRLKLKQANLAKDKFIAHMSHELRTPLNSVIGFSDILKQDPNLDSDQLKSVEIVNRSGHHLLTLINDVLNLSKLTANKLELKHSNFNLSWFLHDITTIFQTRAQNKDISFEIKIPEDIPAVVNADETRLRQVLFNLLSNAIKFTPVGTVTLSVSLLPTVDPAKTTPVRFQISDTGIGIPQDQYDTVFATFGQLNTDSSNSEGTGLGLPICQNILQLMNSDLHLESRVNEGSSFWFDLDLEQVDDVDLSLENKPLQQEVRRHLATPTKVLVTDDNQENRLLLIKYLESLGFIVEEAANGKTGIAIAEEFNPDIILVDLLMPVMNGKEMIEAVRQHSSLQDTVMLIISANLQSIIDSSDIHCDGFIAKPIDLKKLLELLDFHLDLDWQIYETESQLVKPECIDIIIPSQPTLDGLLKLVTFGRMKELLRQINLLEEINPEYSAFAQKIRHLANSFQQDRLEELIKNIS